MEPSAATGLEDAISNLLALEDQDELITGVEVIDRSGCGNKRLRTEIGSRGRAGRARSRDGDFREAERDRTLARKRSERVQKDFAQAGACARYVLKDRRTR